VGAVTREQQYWLIEPLLDAGLDLDEIRSLVFRLGFEGIVCAETGGGSDVHRLVGDQPIPVQAAWARMVDRMLALAERSGWAPAEDATR
jgi:hypothetical protein